MLVYIYSPTPLTTLDISDRCRVSQLSVKDQAEEGAVALSSLVIDDPDGDLELTGHRRLYIYEDTAPAGNQLIYNGFTANERIIRGPSGRTGASRQWVVDLADVNVLINRRIMNGEDANRPAENDLERIQALLTMTELNTVDDDSLVSITAGTTDMDAADYRGQNVGQYIDDCRQASGKNAYIYYNETLGEYGLWYDFASSDAYDSECFLTNTIGEENGTTTFLYSQERTYLNRDPSRVASGIYLEYDGGTVYVQDTDTIDAFAAIDWAAPSVNVKTVAKATARANRYLVGAATEHEIIHVVMTKVPRASVNAIKKGHLVSFKSSYMTGYEEYVVCRVMYRTVTEISEDPTNSFEIEMDLDPTVVVALDLFLCRAQAPNGSLAESPGPISWVQTGDDEETTACAHIPTVGPFTFLYNELGAPRGFIVNATGEFTFESSFQSFGVRAGDHTVNILRNGTTVATDSCSNVADVNGCLMTINATVTCSAGDEFTAEYISTHWDFYVDYYDFRITDGNLTVE